MGRRSLVGAIAAAVLAGLTSTAVVSASASASTPGVNSKTITLGLITSLTGPAASGYSEVVPSAEARIDQQNAEGGVDGRKIKLIVEDDATNPSNNQTAASALLSKGVFGVMEDSAVAFGGYKVLQQAGVPVTGSGVDGPEWFEQPNTNMFSISGPMDPKDPQTDAYALFAKARGGTVCGSVGYSVSPSSAAAASGFEFACQAAGLKNGFLDNSLAFGSVNVTTLVLQLKAAGVNTLYLPLDENTNFAILTAAKQAGLDLKVVIAATGYGQSLLKDRSALPDAQGVWFGAQGAPLELDTAATKAFHAALVKYAHWSGDPDGDLYGGWGGADLMIEGLKLAGKDPTRAGFIKALQKVTNYTTGGLEPPVNFTLSHFGKAPSRVCSYLAQLKGSAFVNPKLLCGSYLPNSDQLPNA